MELKRMRQPPLHWDDSEYRPMTEKIIKAFFRVHDALGPGLLEKAYQNALAVELRKHFEVETEKRFPVMYEDVQVAEYVADLAVERCVLIETKAVKQLDETNKAQLIAQLRASGLLIGFLVNFAKAKLEFKRYDNFHKLKRMGLWKET